MKDQETKNKDHEVFISYASDKGDSTGSRDREAADKVYTALKSRGIGCWAAHRDIFPGDNWLRAIIDAVEKSKILILVFSENANDSQWVKDEVTMALDEKIWIIPFRIDDVPPRGELKILKYRCQWLDAFKSSMEEHIGELVNVVCRHLGKETKTSEKNELNIWEWCEDWYEGDYYKKSPIKNPKGPEKGYALVVRGGCWSYYASYLRCALRGNVGHSNRYDYVGFRLCQDR